MEKTLKAKYEYLLKYCNEGNIDYKLLKVLIDDYTRLHKVVYPIK